MGQDMKSETESVFRIQMLLGDGQRWCICDVRWQVVPYVAPETETARLSTVESRKCSTVRWLSAAELSLCHVRSLQKPARYCDRWFGDPPLRMFVIMSSALNKRVRRSNARWMFKPRRGDDSFRMRQRNLTEMLRLFQKLEKSASAEIWPKSTRKVAEVFEALGVQSHSCSSTWSNRNALGFKERSHWRSVWRHLSGLPLIAEQLDRKGDRRLLCPTANHFRSFRGHVTSRLLRKFVRVVHSARIVQPAADSRRVACVPTSRFCGIRTSFVVLARSRTHSGILCAPEQT